MNKEGGWTCYRTKCLSCFMSNHGMLIYIPENLGKCIWSFLVLQLTQYIGNLVFNQFQNYVRILNKINSEKQCISIRLLTIQSNQILSQNQCNQILCWICPNGFIFNLLFFLFPQPPVLKEKHSPLWACC